MEKDQSRTKLNQNEQSNERKKKGRRKKKMYINDIHIAYYAIAIIASIVIGQLVDWANKKNARIQKIPSKDIINEYKIEFKPNYILILVIAIIYVTLLYNYGIKPTLIANLDLIKYLIISPMLVSAFVIDYKHQIIPNRLNLTLFEIGIIFAFFYMDYQM